jgi:hypothetical protein
VLRKLARVSGGEFFEPSRLSDIIPVFNRISKDIRNRYTIAYVPDGKDDRRVIRTVKVTAKRNGRELTVHSRSKYSMAVAASKRAAQTADAGVAAGDRP